MKVLAAKIGERRYLIVPDKWTETMAEATDFGSFLPLLDYCRLHKLKNVEALFWFDLPEFNFRLKIIRVADEQD